MVHVTRSRQQGLASLEFWHITPTRNLEMTGIVETMYSLQLHAHLTTCNVSLITIACQLNHLI